MFSHRDDRQENLSKSNLDKSKFYWASKSLKPWTDEISVPFALGFPAKT